MTSLSFDLRQQIREIRSREKMRRLEIASLGEPRCMGCGGEHDGYTMGCDTCMDRRQRRRNRREVQRKCGGCGIDHDKRTPGCRTCTYRHSYRSRQAQTMSA